MTLAALALNLAALNRELILQFAREVIEENRPLLEDMNALQLKEGLRSDGSDITPFYTPFTIQLKQEKGQPTDRVTLYDTGAFWEGIHAQVSGNILEFIGTDSKTAELEEKYGEKILGLSEDNKSEFVNAYLRDGVLLKLRNHLGL